MALQKNPAAGGGGTRILVLGGGYTGLMTAVRAPADPAPRQVTLLNPSDRFVGRLRLHQLVTGQRLADLRIPDLVRAGASCWARARAYLHRALDRLGVDVHAGVDVTKVLPGAVEVDGDLEPVAAGAVVWTRASAPPRPRAPALAAEAGLEVDGLGRVVVDHALRSTSVPAIYAIGDAAAVRQPWGTLHGSCQSRLPSAARRPVRRPRRRRSARAPGRRRPAAGRGGARTPGPRLPRPCR